MNESEGRSRRRRRRATAAQGAPAPRPDLVPQPTPAATSADTPAAMAGTPAEASVPRRRRGGERGGRDPSEAGLRDIVGGGSSQLGVEGALRGRDVNRPTEQDLAEAEREVVLVRRHWTPSTKR